MGRKITVDSATLMNKGFEIIEAVHLFGVPAERIEVVIHKESILHSAIEYIDNTVIGELSAPDMRACVQYAVDYPHRTSGIINELDLFSVGTLSFFKPDTEAFSLLKLAKKAISLGGAVPASLNAADEVAVEAFLGERLSFLGISDAVSETVERLGKDASGVTDLDGILAVDKEARRICKEIIDGRS
jgi:1-deoxy-D-xylulose-5-phosphate reductoisomerase